MRTKSIILLASICIVTLTAHIIISYYLNNNNPNTLILQDNYMQTVKWETKYKKCMRAKRLVIPCSIVQYSECKDRLELAMQALDNIQLWCNPYCQEELNTCMNELSLVSSYYWSDYTTILHKED
jgi:hypothetical protein